MKKALVPFYRNGNLYTLFYDREDGLTYKVPFHEQTSVARLTVYIIAFYIITNLLNGYYQQHHSLFLDIALVIIGIGIVYFVVSKLYRTSYMEDKIRPIFLNETFLEECVKEGMKQSRVEIFVIVVSLVFSIVCFAVFFTISSVKPLVFGYLGILVIWIGIYMTKPLRKRKVLKGLRSGKIHVN